MHTFASELKTPFGERLEALHVIDPSQVWVGVVPAGPGGLGMIGNYKTMESFDYQDELAQAILRVVTIVPFGVLCFMPSYASLDRLLQRMKQKGVYDSISSIKTVMVEPKQGTAKDFDAFMAKYYGCIQEAKRNRGMSKITGALLFAVYRGKISEGLDLADENARAVIPVGIPYPSYLDQKVIQKREYNDRFSHTKRLLTGQQWYEIQAFRTLNQALGRCIRHRHDWGAIFLVEQRFATSPRTCAQLSRWVRSSVRVFDAFETAIGELNKFISMNHSSKNNGKY